ncbi:MAG: cytochrome c biogenesis protein CcsA [Chloroflexi bacterium]|uniref:cytochrome c biogenesis protein n=1 Tax=Candidatus Flexifilum breve TaxID=3140694 RepID=UPI00313543C3|nr:cytochrome c biogenesis protein CcsA [Chloroflexota bacterium]
MNLAQRLHLAPTSEVGSSVSINRRDQTLRILTLLAVLGFAVCAYLALGFAGTDVNQGNVQRIFYFHVSAFSAASCALFMAVVGGIAFLRTRNAAWDRLSLAGVEVGLSLSLVTLITGMVWARPTWNTWWTWDPRLTACAIMTLTYAAYLMLRGAIENPDKRRLLAAVYGILAFGMVIVTYAIIRIRPDTIHPTVIGPSAQNAQGGFSMAQSMGITLGISSLVWCCFIAPALVWWRIRLENLYERAQQLRVELM